MLVAGLAQRVIDVTHMDKGTIAIRHVRRPVECRIGDLRRHMPFFVFLAASNSFLGHAVTTWTDCRATVDSHGGKGEQILLGNVPPMMDGKLPRRLKDFPSFCGQQFHSYNVVSRQSLVCNQNRQGL